MRTRNYYRVRTVVRVVVWGGLASALAIGIGRVTANDRPLCSVRVTPSGWQATTTEPVNLDECRAPSGVRLLPNGAWEWATPER